MYDKLSEERKRLQEEGLLPEWFTTGGWQLFKERYMYEVENPRQQYMRIAKTLARHMKYDVESWEEKFFNIMWRRWFSPSTPLLGNTGTDRGLPVSCAGSYISDSIDEIYKAKHEVAMLTKMGFGTASYLGDIRHRGAPISVGGKAEGVMPIIKGFHHDMEYVSQGNARRGSWAGYLPIDHGDFYEVCEYLESNPDGNNIGWCVSDDFIENWKNGGENENDRYRKALGTKMPTGKGYYFFSDKANRKRPEWYKERGLDIKSPQLCVAPETKILTKYGYMTISDLVDQNIDVWNGEEWSNVVVRKTGDNQKLVTVKTDSGFELTCTEYHKWYVKETQDRNSKIVEKRTHELQPGDKVIKLTTEAVEGIAKLDKAYQNGFYSGDGCEVDGAARIYLYGEKRELSNLFPNKIKHYIQDGQNREYFYIDGLKKKYFVPDSSYTIDSRVEWLCGLFDADGTVTRNGEAQGLQLCSTNHDFLRDIQLMLQTLGVQSRIKFMREEGKYNLPANDGSGQLKEFDCKECHRIMIAGAGIAQLMKLGAKFHRLNVVDREPSRDCISYVKIAEIVDEGRIDSTFCFTEPKKSMGVFNGILTGNCNEIMLHSSEKYTYTCNLGSMVAATYDEWKDTDAAFVASVLLDCVVSEFIEKASGVPGLEKAVASTIKGRAIGLGVCGYHTYLQKNMIPFESIDAYFFNHELFSHIKEESERATKWLAEEFGECEWCKGWGRRNTHTMAVAPTKSTALIMGGISEGISPDVGWVYTQRTPAGEVDRVNPQLLEIMKDRGVYNKRVVEDIRETSSVQHVDWLTDEEKRVFKNAFEIDQMVVLRKASARAQYIDQWQSLNLFFPAGTDEDYINKVHVKAFLDEDILGLYYVYSSSSVQASNDKDECSACQ